MESGGLPLRGASVLERMHREVHTELACRYKCKQGRRGKHGLRVDTLGNNLGMCATQSNRP